MSKNVNKKMAAEALLMLQRDHPGSGLNTSSYQLKVHHQMVSSHILKQTVPVNTPHNPNRSLLGPKQKKIENTRAQIPKPVVKPAPIMNNLPSQGIPREEQQNVTRVMNYINEPPATSRPSLSPPGVSETVELSQYSFQNRERFVHVNDKDRISAAQVTPTPIPSKPAEDDDMKGALLPPKMPGWHGATIYSNLPEAVQQEFDLIMRESYYVKKESIDKENSEYNDEDSPVRRRGPGRLEAIERNKNNEASKRSRQRKKYLNQVLQNSLNYDLDENYLLYKQEKWLISIIKNLEVKFLHKASQNRGIIKAMRRECGFEE